MYGLAMQGGGALGAAHVGVLRALLEEGYPPAWIAGTSAGSMVAAAYAYRGDFADVQAMADAVQETGLGLLDLNITGLIHTIFTWILQRNMTFMGVFKGKKLEKLMRQITDDVLLGQARIPVAIPAVDLNRGTVYTYASHPTHRRGMGAWQTEGSLAQAVRASSAIPVLFCPPTDGSALLVDGGVLENLPVSALLRMGAPRVLGVTLTTARTGPPALPDDVLGIAQRSIEAMQRRLLALEKCAADYLLSVELPPGSGMFSFNQIESFIQAGYDAGKRAMPDVAAFMSGEAGYTARFGSQCSTTLLRGSAFRM